VSGVRIPPPALRESPAQAGVFSWWGYPPSGAENAGGGNESGKVAPFLKPLRAALWERARAQVETDLRLAVAMALELSAPEIRERLGLSAAEVNAAQARVKEAAEDLR
jgi:hypothetical protein